ncbi:hypothetical protein E3N88_24451 [Mikania micrantha]|uniref:Uncharacterized protein n=1 Tax=Mikania micrantha TaxID=192012 RepID=A0A5N6N394_9ASTR|nr:hypothetical protein E3N88_24451 [Mikania micrantha]
MFFWVEKDNYLFLNGENPDDDGRAMISQELLSTNQQPTDNHRTVVDNEVGSDFQQLTSHRTGVVEADSVTQQSTSTDLISGG